MRRHVVPLLLLAAFCSGCEQSQTYLGDGKLVDNGASAATDRYVLDLGPIALKERGSKSYRIERLPSTRFAVGIQVRPASKSAQELEAKPIDATVSVSLTGPKGETVFADESTLRTWTWSVPATGDHAFLYREGKGATFFSPVPEGRYELKIAVKTPDSGKARYDAFVMMKSGGWK